MEGGSKMKKLSLAIIANIGIHVIVYSMFSFAMWDFNPEHWGGVQRIIFTLISFILSLFISVTILTND
jgi:hypothetical protein